MIEAGRLARAIHLQAERVDLHTFRVSGGAQHHTVELRDGGCFCDCWDSRIHGDGCKHSLIVRLLGGDEEVVRALRQLIPAPRKAKERVAI